MRLGAVCQGIGRDDLIKISIIRTNFHTTITTLKRTIENSKIKQFLCWPLWCPIFISFFDYSMSITPVISCSSTTPDLQEVIQKSNIACLGSSMQNSCINFFRQTNLNWGYKISFLNQMGISIIISKHCYSSVIHPDWCSDPVCGCIIIGIPHRCKLSRPVDGVIRYFNIPLRFNGSQPFHR